jgi:hypothetical protein
MLHFKDFVHYENHDDAKSEFDLIFSTNSYVWQGSLGKSRDSFFGVTNDPLNPSWGVFGKLITDYPHSQLYFRRIFKVRLVYGNVDFDFLERSLSKDFDFIMTNEFGLSLPKYIRLDSINIIYPLPHRHKINLPSLVDSI